jgi:hypothetical protein
MRLRPRKDPDFIAWALNLSTQCTAHQTDWHLDAETVATLYTLVERADTSYKASRNKETANHFTTVTKNECFKALKVFLSTFTLALKANLNVPNADLVAMGLPSRERHAYEPLPAPTEAPNIYANVGQHGAVTLFVGVPAHGRPTEQVGRKRYHGFVLKHRKEDETEWHEQYTTRLHVTLSFDHADEGKHLSLMAAWINPRLQHGPWSNELKVLIN